MTPFGLTTIVDLAPRLVLPFSLPAALWLEIMGAFAVSLLGVVHAAFRGLRLRPAAKRPSGQVIPLRPSLRGQAS